MKIFSHCGELMFLGTVENPTNGNISVGKGSYDLTKSCLYSNPFNSPTNNRCEKNWCYFHTAKGELKSVYAWRPLQIGDVEEENIRLRFADNSVPAFFNDFRGSSNGCLVDDEVWFLCHLVEYCVPRHYYHIIVVIDANTMKFKRHSILFKFHSECIEYALGFIVEPKRAVFSYSRMDRTSAIMTLDREVMERELFPITPGVAAICKV